MKVVDRSSIIASPTATFAEQKATLKTGRDHNSRHRQLVVIAFAATVLAISTPGCYEQHLAPAVEYSQEDVQVLRDEVEQMDWE